MQHLISHLSACARQLRHAQDASEQRQELVRDGNTRLAARRLPLSIAAPVGWRPARLGMELGALRVASWPRLGIPGNVLCMEMQWIRTIVSLPALMICLLQRCFVPSRRFFVSV
jgi:cytochrome oxidase assembly protein ShyY1